MMHVQDLKLEVEFYNEESIRFVCLHDENIKAYYSKRWGGDEFDLVKGERVSLNCMLEEKVSAKGNEYLKITKIYSCEILNMHPDRLPKIVERLAYSAIGTGIIALIYVGVANGL